MAWLLCSIREVVAKCILFSGMDFREREVIVDAMEEKSFGAVRDPALLVPTVVQPRSRWVAVGAGPCVQDDVIIRKVRIRCSQSASPRG